MSVILLETHQRIVKKIKKRAFIIHGFGILLTVFIMLFPWVDKIQSDLIRASYQVVRHHLVELESRYALLEVLRNKPLTVGQSLEIADVIIEESRSSGVPMHIVLGVIGHESSFKVDAVSSVGARGLMQIMPAVWSYYVDGSLAEKASRHSPALNVRVGVRYLGDLFKRYGDWKKVLRVYGGFVTKSPDPYVNAVMVKAEQYRILLGGDHGNSCADKEEKANKIRQ